MNAKEAELVRELDRELADIISFFLRKEAELLSKVEVRAAFSFVCFCHTKQG